MDKTIETLYSIQNLYFLLIICGSIFLAYIVSIIISSASNIVEERNPHLVWLFDIISAPLLMFIMNIGYGFGFNFLNIPSKSGLEPSITIVLAINVGILAASLVPFILIKSIKAVSSQIARLIKTGLILIILVVILVTFLPNLKALVVSILLSALFFGLTVWMMSKPKPKIAEPVVIPKKLVISHIYIATSESHENIAKASELIRDAISEIHGTGDSPQASASGFIPGAVDIIVKYFITDPARLEDIKAKVNLNILKKLNEKNIKLASA